MAVATYAVQLDDGDAAILAKICERFCNPKSLERYYSDDALREALGRDPKFVKGRLRRLAKLGLLEEAAERRGGPNRKNHLGPARHAQALYLNLELPELQRELVTLASLTELVRESGHAHIGPLVAYLQKRGDSTAK